MTRSFSPSFSSHALITMSIRKPKPTAATRPTEIPM